jgi:hypothetical protein
MASFPRIMLSSPEQLQQTPYLSLTPKVGGESTKTHSGRPPTQAHTLVRHPNPPFAPSPAGGERSPYSTGTVVFLPACARIRRWRSRVGLTSRRFAPASHPHRVTVQPNHPAPHRTAVELGPPGPSPCRRADRPRGPLSAPSRNPVAPTGVAGPPRGTGAPRPPWPPPIELHLPPLLLGARIRPRRCKLGDPAVTPQVFIRVY